MYTHVRGTVHKTEQPLIVAVVLGDAGLAGEEHVRAVDDGLVHLPKAVSLLMAVDRLCYARLTPWTAAESEQRMTR